MSTILGTVREQGQCRKAIHHGLWLAAGGELGWGEEDRSEGGRGAESLRQLPAYRVPLPGLCSLSRPYTCIPKSRLQALLVFKANDDFNNSQGQKQREEENAAHLFMVSEKHQPRLGVVVYRLCIGYRKN